MTTNTLPRAAVFRLLIRTADGLRAFADTAPRKDLIAFCVWNDPNGCWTDRDMRLEFGRVATTEELRAIVRGWADEHDVSEIPTYEAVQASKKE